MNPHKLLIPSLLCIIALCCCFIETSCKKKHGSSPLNNIRFSTITETNGALIYTVRVTYNAQGNVDSMVYSTNDSGANTTGYNAFTYYSNYFLIHHSSGGADSVVLNSKGNIAQVYQNGSSNDTLDFIYDNNNRLIDQVVHTYNPGPGSSVDTTSYQWNSFDVTSITPYLSAPTYYNYNLDVSGQAGDALRINQFLTYGRTYLNSTHIPVYATYYGNIVDVYLYQFDADGRVSTLKIAENYSSGSNLDTIIYAYQYAN